MAAVFTLLMLSLTASLALGVPTGDSSLPVFGITLNAGQWNVATVQGAFSAFFGNQYCTIVELAYYYNRPLPDFAYFQFAGSRASSESMSLLSTIVSANSFAALQVSFQGKNLNLISINYTLPGGSHVPSSGSAASGGSWAAQHPEIIAGIAAGALVVVLGGLICWIQRRSKRQERLRETMEAMIGDDDVRAAARGEAPAPSSGKKRAPGGSMAKATGAPRPRGATQGEAARRGPAVAYAPPHAGHRERLVSFYTKYNPEKLPSVDATLASYAGRENELFAALSAKYGPEEPAPGPGSNNSNSKSLENGGHQSPRGENGPASTPQPPQQAKSTSPQPESPSGAREQEQASQPASSETTRKESGEAPEGKGPEVIVASDSAAPETAAAGP